MKKRFRLTAAFFFAAVAAPAAETNRPNIVLILADDLGHGDLGCYGATDVRTPAIDRLAREGVRLTQCYSNGPECTPTRTALLTGRYQNRFGGLECAIGVGNVGRYGDAIRLAQQRDLGLPPQTTSLPQTLADRGYRTLIAGKWHLGYEPKFSPRRHGFHEWFGILGGYVDYFHHGEPEWPVGLVRDDVPLKAEGYFTDLVASEAVRQIAQHRSKPFFLYVPFTAPHSPFQGPNDWAPQPVKSADATPGDRATYVAMIERLDRGVGDILTALQHHALTDNTIVVFSSDNGGVARIARNAPFSGGKGSLIEGGIRVPGIVRWPARVKAGSTSDAVVLSMDLTPTFARLVGAEFPAGTYDGVDVVHALTGEKPAAPRTVFWRYRRGAKEHRAVRDGDLKFLQRNDRNGATEELFDLKSDPAEKHDLAKARPAELERLKALHARWEKDVAPIR